MLSALVLTGAIVATLVAAYEWTGLPRHWQMRVWTTALAAMLWLTWLCGTTDAAGSLNGPVLTVAVELHPRAMLAGDDPEAVVLDLVQPQPAKRRLLGFVGRHGAMNPAGRAFGRGDMGREIVYPSKASSFSGLSGTGWRLSMKRREFITLLGVAAVGWPLAVRAQQPTMPVIGYLGSESPARSASLLRFFYQGLGELGFVEGQNLAIDYRWADGQNDRLPALAVDLVRRKVSVIAAPATTPGALAAKAATETIPIVIFTAGDPVALGLVVSLNRPGGNVTGTTSLAGELAPKRLELMRELMPNATILALLVNPTNSVLTETTMREAQAAARTLGIELHILHARTEREFDAVFARLAQLRVSGLVIAVDSFFTARREQLAELALRRRVPAIYQSRDFAEAGGVMSYGGSLADGFRLVGLYTGRILKGEKPADLPVQQATKAELIINLKTAKALGLDVPPTLIARADEVIE